MTETPFGIKRKKVVYEDYIGRWALIYPTGLNTTFSGKIVAIVEGNAILNPFQHGEIKEGKLVRKLITDKTGSLVPLIGSTIEPTTEKYLIDYCEMMNKKEEQK